MKIGALWINKMKDGRTYYSGTLDIDGKKTKIAVFPTKEKKSDKSPDFEIVSNEKKANNQSDDNIPF